MNSKLGGPDSVFLPGHFPQFTKHYEFLSFKTHADYIRASSSRQLRLVKWSVALAVQESFSTISEEKKLQTTLIRTAAMVAVDMNILDREAYLAYMQTQCLGQLKSIGTGEPAARVWAEKLVESIQSTVDFIELHGGTKSGNA